MPSASHCPMAPFASSSPIIAGLRLNCKFSEDVQIYPSYQCAIRRRSIRSICCRVIHRPPVQFADARFAIAFRHRLIRLICHRVICCPVQFAITRFAVAVTLLDLPLRNSPSCAICHSICHTRFAVARFAITRFAVTLLDLPLRNSPSCAICRSICHHVICRHAIRHPVQFTVTSLDLPLHNSPSCAICRAICHHAICRHFA
jgi:hypothetical protein